MTREHALATRKAHTIQRRHSTVREHILSKRTRSTVREHILQQENRIGALARRSKVYGAVMEGAPAAVRR
jgi:hypothetical protein